MTVRPRATTDARFTFDVLRADRPVLVDFHADWCRSCRLLDPVLDELAEAWGDRIRIVKLDVEANPHTAERYGVKGIPTLILFDGGEERDRLVNVIRRRAIEDRLGTLVPMTTDGTRPDRTAGSHQVVRLVGEILAVAVAARSLLTDRPGATMGRTPRHQETRCAATRSARTTTRSASGASRARYAASSG